MDQKSVSAPATTTTFRNLRPRTVRGTAVTQRTQKRLQVGSDFDNLRRGRKKRSVSDKGKEEDDIEDYEDDDDDNNNHERLESISSSDDEDDDNDKVRPVASKETVTQMQFCRTAKVNIAYLDVLLKEAAHLRGQPHSKHSMERLMQVDQRIEHVSRALEDWGLPILQATQPVDHPVAPTVPEADGSEKRFTNVARAMGLDWSKVNDDRKQEVYTRAAQYHKDKYGVFPSKVRVHTSWGMRPMYYYNEHTYVETMQRALQEYMDQLYGH